MVSEPTTRGMERLLGNTTPLTSAGRSPDPPGFKTVRDTFASYGSSLGWPLSWAPAPDSKTVLRGFLVVAKLMEELACLDPIGSGLGQRDELVDFPAVLQRKQ